MEDPPAASPDEPLGALLRRASEAPMALSRAELARLLSLEDPAERAALHAAALAQAAGYHVTPQARRAGAAPA